MSSTIRGGLHLKYSWSLIWSIYFQTWDMIWQYCEHTVYCLLYSILGNSSFDFVCQGKLNRMLPESQWQHYFISAHTDWVLHVWTRSLFPTLKTQKLSSSMSATWEIQRKQKQLILIEVSSIVVCTLETLVIHIVCSTPIYIQLLPYFFRKWEKTSSLLLKLNCLSVD